ncbi:hypothetical protein B0H14DRAFT_2632941 [Mycena olivaceomarginata]|nr:hypothetical protein B0H14DRAFT_2632941 [Mycena olivaceomarginata]
MLFDFGSTQRPSPDPYPSEGPGVNYFITRDLVAYKQGLIDHTMLLSRRGIKLEENLDFGQRLCGYRPCQQLYRHEWKVIYTTPERKSTEHLVQDEMCFARRPRTRVLLLVSIGFKL